MKHQQYLILLFLVGLTLNSLISHGQSLPVGSSLLNDVYRREQLLGNVDLSASFTAQPFAPYLFENQGYYLNNTTIQDELSDTLFSIFSGHTFKNGSIKILPFTWKQQYNSKRPEGLNNGAMIPARGYQTMLSGGFYARYAWLSIQLMPELVWAKNSNFDGFPAEHSNDLWRSYYSYAHRQIDLPEKFGDGPYQKAFWGQSSIRITKGAFSLGLSNENLWWGPGMKNALIMTNNAPGFRHVTLNTVKPVKTPIGSFEGQLIGGMLETSGYPAMDTLALLLHGVKYIPKPSDWRYLNGIVLSYQPRWIPGLYVGASRVFQTYHELMGKTLYDYLPVIMPISKKASGNDVADQLAAIFIRLVAPKDHLEIYLEYGRGDHSYDLRDFLLEPEHSSGYLVGVRKLVPIARRKNEYIDLQLEITQLEAHVSVAKRTFARWYTHSRITQGYTHQGQMLGAGIGSGSNMQSLQMSWVKNMKRFGVEFKRVAIKEDFWTTYIKEYRTHWVDMGGALYGEWNYRNFMFHARFETIGSINYQFVYNPVPKPGSAPSYWDHGKINYNFHSELGFTYSF
jgi:hypothetical protein